jgi:ribosomal protein S20
MEKSPEKNTISRVKNKEVNLDVNSMRRNRIENLKRMINNEDYMNEAIIKLANSLTSGLMK